MTNPITQLLFSSASAAVILASPAGEYAPDMACGFAGLFGGAIMQLLTFDERKPKPMVLLGEMLSSATAGWGSFVLDSDNELRLGLLIAIAAGSGGAFAFRSLIKLVLPSWVGTREEKK